MNFGFSENYKLMNVGSLTQWTWIWANSRRSWRTGKPGVLQFLESQKVRHNLAAEQQPCGKSPNMAPRAWGFHEYISRSMNVSWATTIYNRHSGTHSWRFIKISHCSMWYFSNYGLLTFYPSGNILLSFKILLLLKMNPASFNSIPDSLISFSFEIPQCFVCSWEYIPWMSWYNSSLYLFLILLPRGEDPDCLIRISAHAVPSTEP